MEQKKKQVSVVLTQPYLDAFDCLVQGGVYANRANIIKDALRQLFRHYGLEPFGAERSAGKNAEKNAVKR